MRRRGSILILVLFVLTVLSLLAVSFAYRAGMQLRAAQHRALHAQLKAQAASTAAIAIARLAGNTNDFDHRAEPWHTHVPLAAEEWDPVWSSPPEGGDPLFAVDYQVVDEDGKLNVLTASSEALEKVGMSPEQIAALFDWMDADDNAGVGGAEKDYYMKLSTPYACKNASIQTLEELLLIRGFGPSDYYGEDANHNWQLDPEENDGAPQYPPDDADGKLRQGWVDLLTCGGSGGINLNTAPPAVLRTLPISDNAVSQILAFREFDGNSGDSLDKHVFRTSQDIDQLQGLTDPEKAILGAVGVFKSSEFRIFVQTKHVSSSLRYNLQVLVKIGSDGPEVMQWKEGTP
jgi:hypothetical protein